MPRLLSIVGKSGSGKTTLLERLIPALQRGGLRVGAIKHHAHPGFEIDRPGKDTWRLAQAGSRHTVLIAPDKMAAIRRLDGELPVHQAAAGMDDVDLVLTEGFKRAGLPAIEVVRRQNGLELVAGPPQLRAVVSDTPLTVDVPQFGLDDAAGLAAWIVAHLAELPLAEPPAPALPLAEFDPQPTALINPQPDPLQPAPEHCLICFFQDVLEQVIAERQAQVIDTRRWEDGPHPVYEIAFQGRRLAFYHPGIGAPLAAALLEEVIPLGCRKFIACGGAGVLTPGSTVGQLLVVDSALRDEGVSYHYLPPQPTLQAQPAGVQALVRVLERHAAPYQVGRTWTTDAPYRETPAKIARRRAEGCLMVEMEAAAMLAVSQFRGVAFGQVLYGGDDVSGSEWDNRAWQSRQEVRTALFWLAAEAVFEL